VQQKNNGAAMETMMDRAISHDRREETIEAKARWFQSLPIAGRMELLCQFTDLILTVHPEIVEKKNAQPIAGRVCVLSEA
jgi:hypothetical protein